MRHFLILIPLQLLLLNQVFAQNNTANLAGDYDGGRLKLSYDSVRKNLTGIVLQEINPDEKNKEYCKVYFYGKVDAKNDSTLKIKLFLPGDDSTYQGVLIVHKKEIEIQTQFSLFPCQRTIDLMGGELFSKTSAKNYNELGMISAKRVKSYSAASLDSLKKAYLVQGDFVQILEQKEDWYLINYVKNPKFKAWIKREDIICASQMIE